MNFLLKMMSNKRQSDVIKLSFALLKRQGDEQGESNIKTYFTALKFALRVKLTRLDKQSEQSCRSDKNLDELLWQTRKGGAEKENR